MDPTRGVTSAVVDTDVLSHMWRRRVSEAVQQHLIGTLCVSFVTSGEVWEGMTQAQWTADDRDKLASFVNQRFVLLEGNAAIGKRWGELAGEARRGGRTIPSNDCLV